MFIDYDDTDFATVKVDLFNTLNHYNGNPAVLDMLNDVLGSVPGWLNLCDRFDLERPALDPLTSYRRTVGSICTRSAADSDGLAYMVAVIVFTIIDFDDLPKAIIEILEYPDGFEGGRKLDLLTPMSKDCHPR